MKILLVVHNYPPEFLGGVERAVAMLAHDLSTRGHSPLVFCGSAVREKASRIVREEWDGIPIVRYVAEHGFPNPADEFDPIGDAAFDDLLAEFSPDVVHVHHWVNHGAAAVALAARRGIPAVVSLHDYWTTCSLYFRVPDGKNFCAEKESVDACLPCIARYRGTETGELAFGLDMRFAALAQELRLARAVLLSGEELSDRVLALSRHAETIRGKIRIVPLGSVRPATLEKRTASADSLVIGHWGNITELKGIYVLAAAAARAKFADRMTIKFIGRVLDRGSEEKLRAEARPARVEFTGPYRTEDLRRHLEDVDIAVFPSLAAETHSMVVDEALAFGLPIVVSDRGSPARRLADSVIVTRAGDPDALAAALDRLVSPEERSRYSHLSSSVVCPTSSEHASVVENLYNEIVGARSAGPVVIDDHNRTRLAFRKRRLAEIYAHVVGVTGRCADLEAAILGDRSALARVAEFSPELAERLGRTRNGSDVS